MKYLVCNLKGNKTYQEMLLYQEYLSNLNTKINFILAPSNLYFNLFSKANINLCCQDISLYEHLNLTGDITFKQLQSLNVQYLLVGHYERKKYYAENLHNMQIKIQNALKNNLKVIYCIGETKEELDRKVTYQVLAKALAHIFNNISQTDLKNIIIAYEPTYLIGTKNTYDMPNIIATLNFIKTLCEQYYHINIPVIFGGNINPTNIDDFLHIKNLDGFIIGEASLNPQNIPIILAKMTQLEE